MREKRRKEGENREKHETERDKEREIWKAPFYEAAHLLSKGKQNNNKTATTKITRHKITTQPLTSWRRPSPPRGAQWRRSTRAEKDRSSARSPWSCASCRACQRPSPRKYNGMRGDKHDKHTTWQTQKGSEMRCFGVLWLMEKTRECQHMETQLNTFQFQHPSNTNKASNGDGKNKKYTAKINQINLFIGPGDDVVVPNVSQALLGCQIRQHCQCVPMQRRYGRNKKKCATN